MLVLGDPFCTRPLVWPFMNGLEEGVISLSPFVDSRMRLESGLQDGAGHVRERKED